MINRRCLPILLAVILIFTAVINLSVFAEDTQSSAVAISCLKTEYAENPLGIDVTNPRLSWNIESAQRAQTQKAYQIIVASSSENLASDKGDMWDSGKIVSDQSINIIYKGSPLQSCKRYFWKVRVWDRDGNLSVWSNTAWWEMGLLKPEDWSAKWISLGSEAADQSPTQYNVDLDFTILQDAVGVIFGAQNSGNFYMWQINVFDKPYAQLRPHKWVNGGAALYTPEVDISSVIPEDKELNTQHHLKIGVDSGTIKTYIDGQLVDTRTDTTFPYGKIGFRQCSDNRTNERGLIDNLKVTDETGKVLFQDYFHDQEEMKFDGGTIVNGQLQVQNGIIMQGSTGNASPMLRKSFNISKEIKSARVYSTALGLYELYINGQRVGHDVLNPGWTDYNKRVQYQTYDVTDLLKSGDNAIGAVLGMGWYAGNVAMAGSGIYGTEPTLLSQLAIEYTDGTKETVISDETWRSTDKGPILYNDNLMGETYDARREIAGWTTPLFDDSQWNASKVVNNYKGQLVAQVGPTVQVTQYMNTKKITEPAAGTYIFDIGQNMVGWVRLKVQGPAGTLVKLRFGEMLNQDGTLYTANLRSAKQTDVYVLKGGDLEIYEPRFTFHGFRYVEVTGYPGVPTTDAITGCVVGSNTNPIGHFETSNALVNQLQSNITWGQRGNFLSVPTDCPQRDERMGWMGDAQIFARTASYNMDVEGFFAKWMRDVEDAQFSSGAFSDVAPYVSIVGGGNAAWGDAGVIVPWTIYQAYGDTRIIEEHYDAMVKWVDYLKNTSNNLIRSAWTYGDWLSINANTPVDVLDTAYFAYSTDLLGKMAKVIGKDEDAQKYQALFNDIKTAFNKAFVSADGHIKGNTQTCYLLGLHMNLLPDDKRDAAAKYLVEDIENRDWHLSTGFVGVGYLTPELTKAGYPDVAYRLLLNETYPSWGYSIINGATTIWERWNSYTKETGFGDIGMNSFNHYSLGSVGEWMYRYVAGIDLDPENPAFKHIIIQPTPGGGLSFVNGEYQSVYGKITSNWKVEGNTFTLNTTIPANTTATVYLPADDAASITESGKAVSEGGVEGVTFLRMEGDKAVLDVGSGSYSFSSIVKQRFDLKINPNDPNILGKVKVNGVTSNLPYFGRFKEGDTVTLEVSPVNDLDYEFSHWTGSFNGSETQLTIVVDKNIDLTANMRYKGIENFANGKKVTVGDNDGAAPMWSPSNLTDGLLISTGATKDDGIKGYTSRGIRDTQDTSSNPKWIQIDLGKDMPISQVRLYPRTDVLTGDGLTPSFPVDFTIQVKSEGGEYVTVADIKDQPNPKGKPQIYGFDERNVRYIKVNVTKLGQMAADDVYYRLQLAEMGAYNTNIDQDSYTLNIGKTGGGIVKINGTLYLLPYIGTFDKGTNITVEPVPYTNESFNDWTGGIRSIIQPLLISMNGNLSVTANFSEQAVNLAYKKTARSVNSLESLPDWSVSNLTDGTSRGYTCNGSTSQDVSGSQRWVEIDLGQNMKFDSVILYPRVNSTTKDGLTPSFPVNFTIETKPDGGQYSVVKSVAGQPNPMGERQVYNIGSQNARYIRVNVTKLGPMASDDTLYRFQLAEMEVYNLDINALTGVKLSAEKPQLKVGETTQLTMAGTMKDGEPANLTNAVISYSSDNNKVAVADQNGLVTTTGEGKANVTASVTLDGITVTDSVEIIADSTAPTITVIGIANGDVVKLNQQVTVAWKANDPLSGVETASADITSGAALDTSSVGDRTLTFTATDKAGNITTSSITYHVQYDFSGVYHPIMADSPNTFKVRSTIPVKFQLKDANGAYVTGAEVKIYIAPVINGVVGDGSKAVSTSAASDENTFRYDDLENNYIFNLNTRNLQPGTYQIRIDIGDGTINTVMIDLE